MRKVVAFRVGVVDHETSRAIKLDGRWHPKCRELREEGHILAIASNQGGVAFGYLDEETATDLCCDVARQIGALGFAVCPHHPKGTVERYARYCLCRKPAPKMLNDLRGALGYAPEDTVFVGDMETDRLAAEAAGVRFEWAKDFFGFGEVGHEDQD